MGIEDMNIQIGKLYMLKINELEGEADIPVVVVDIINMGLGGRTVKYCQIDDPNFIQEDGYVVFCEWFEELENFNAKRNEDRQTL